MRASGDALLPDVAKWLESVPADFRGRLAQAGLIDRERAGGLGVLVETDPKGKVTGGHLIVNCKRTSWPTPRPAGCASLN